MRSWDDRNQRFSVSYDTLRRPVDRTVSVNGGSEKLLGRVVYGELLASPADSNHRGQVYRVYDGAGVATSLGFDFKGQPTSEQRQLVSQKTSQPDWSALLGESTIAAMATAAASLLDAETFSVSSQHDALGRVLTAVSPDGSEVHYSYDEGGGLQTVSLNHRGSVTEETVVGDITYDAQGRREKVVHGSSSSPTTTTSYTYDPIAQRLTRLRTVRHSDDAAIQSLHYHYDPVGNITDIRDTAQQTVYEAANSYEYDALYRLVEASGREHSTQGTTQRSHEQLPIGVQPMSSDPSAMRRYTQKYSYDGVGNILKMQHVPDGGTGWTRHYEYDTDGNRLLATSAPGDDAEGPYTHTYSYDAHGSMTVMPHLPSMVWNHDDELEEVTAGSETVYFQYAGGIRSRKFTEKSGTVTEERIYLGPFEIYRKRINGDLDLERESLHISDGSGRICIVETKTVEDEDPVGSPTGIWRYQHGNHLGSAATEVDGSGAIISYEEYHPYGTSAYRAVDSSIDVSAKRYRYTGMERDEETGLAYHSARYYANWLGRWTASDPIGLGDGVNRYGYAGGRPVGSADRSGNSGVRAIAGALPEYEGSSAPGNWEPIASTVDAEGNAATEWLWIEAGSAEESSIATRDARKRPTRARASAPAAAADDSGVAEQGTSLGDVARATPHAFVLGQGVGFVKGSWNTATALPKLAYGLAMERDATIAGFKKTWREDGPLGFTPFGELGDKIVETGVQLSHGNLYAAGEAWGEGAVAAQNSAAMAYGTGLFARWGLRRLAGQKPSAPRGVIDDAAGGEFLDDAIRGPNAVETTAAKGEKLKIADVIKGPAERRLLNDVFSGKESPGALGGKRQALIDLFRQTASDNPSGSAQAAFNEARAAFLEGKGPSPGNNVVRFAEEHGFPVARGKKL